MAEGKKQRERVEEEGPERIERLPGEMESAMYTGSDEGEPSPGPEELGPLPDRDAAVAVFEEVDRLAEEQPEGEPQSGQEQATERG